MKEREKRERKKTKYRIRGRFVEKRLFVKLIVISIYLLCSILLNLRVLAIIGLSPLYSFGMILSQLFLPRKF